MHKQPFNKSSTSSFTQILIFRTFYLLCGKLGMGDEAMESP